MIVLTKKGKQIPKQLEMADNDLLIEELEYVVTSSITPLRTVPDWVFIEVEGNRYLYSVNEFCELIPTENEDLYNEFKEYAERE